MIKKLRRKFILVAISSVSAVLFVIMGVINITSYNEIISNANKTLIFLSENGGNFPKRDKPRGDHKPAPLDMSPEAPFETRFFSVRLSDTGSVIAVDTGFIAAITTSDAEQYAVDIFKRGKTSGFQNNYKYSVTKSGSELLIVFLDCSRDLSTFNSFLLTSIIVSIAGIISVFILILVFSKMAIKPVLESYEKQKRFITDASHEIKTPLTIIDANTEILQMTNGESEWIRSIRNQVKRLTTLTDSMVALSRMSEEDNRRIMTNFSLSDAVSEALEPFIVLAKNSENKLLISIQENISFNGDERAIRQLVSILCENAIKYSAEKGEIAISLKINRKKVELIFQNTTNNLQKGNQDILFERFYRPDSSRNSSTGGNGIGLSIAKAIVETHKGKITAESIDGKSIRLITLL